MKLTARHTRIGAATISGLVLVLAACDTQSRNQAARNDQSLNNQILAEYQANQPAPRQGKSQVRGNLSEIEKIEMNATVTTTFFFNMGTPDPVYSCPSIGLPIPSTAQLTAPSAKYAGDSDSVIPQVEPTGIYTGDSSGTFVLCVSSKGETYAFYWEGFVMSATANASWDKTNHTVQINGAPTAKITGDVNK